MQAADDLALLIDAAQAAGQIAGSFSGQTTRTWDKPDGAGPVTEADIAVNDMLEERLRTARPGYGWLSEESPDTPERLGCERVFVIDPIDGTRSFTQGSRTWAHSLAVVEAGRPVAAVIYLPLRDLFYSAAQGQGASLNGHGIQVARPTDVTDATVLSSKPAFAQKHWNGPVPRIERAYRPSLAYRAALVAQGRFDAMLTLRDTWEWDIAAGDLILREAGALSTDRHGNALAFNNAEPLVTGVLAAEPILHATLSGSLAP